MNFIKLLSLYLLDYDAPRQLGNYDIPQEKMYIILRILFQGNLTLTEHLIYRTYRTLNFETENKWDGASSRQKEQVKKLEHNICCCIMTRGTIGIPATPSSVLPMAISNCFIPIDIIR